MEREVLTEEKVKELVNEIPITRSVNGPCRIIRGLPIKDFYISESMYITIGLYIFKRMNSFILKPCRAKYAEEQNYQTFYIGFTNCEFDNTILNPIFEFRVVANFGPCSLKYLYDERCIFDSFPLVCPSKGEFVGWKALLLRESDVKDEEGRIITDVIGKLIIPVDAKRSSAFGNKCRCSKATLLEVYTLDNLSDPLCIKENEILTSYMDYAFEYKPGEEVCSDEFDENRWNECGHGIHFFMTREEAVEYAKA